MYCSPRRWVIAVVTPPSAQPAAPAPQSVIGWEPCADYKLATYEQIEDYFRKLAAAVPRADEARRDGQDD